MKIPVFVYAAAVVFLFSVQEEKVSAQILTPNIYSGGPLSYANSDSDDDLGVLLALLLLAARNRGGSGCCCNSCNNVRTIPVPFPIPIPTNNPIIRQNDVVYKQANSSKRNNTPSEIINVDAENEDDTASDTNVTNAPTNKVVAASNSGSSASSSSSAGSNSGRRR